MLWKASAIENYAIAANDGRLGTVHDFLFDDASWLVRWLVVDTGGWLSSRRVLLPPSVIGHPDRVKREFSVGLTMQEVKDSPSIDTDEPVSRQMETDLYDYYGWSPYWDGGFYPGGYGGGMLEPNLMAGSNGADLAKADRKDGDPHLRSIEAVTGYIIHARDGEIGHVEDFLVEDGDWSIHYLVVATRNWWPGNKVLISPASVWQIDWGNRLVSLNVDRQMIKDSPPYDGSTMVDRVYEKHFHNHYGNVALSTQN